MLQGLLLTLNILVCLALIGVVLLQRSEGGALGGGGSPTSLVTARGAGDLLTRTTWILFIVFLTISFSLTLLGGHQRSTESILNRLKGETVNPNLLKRPAPGAAGEPAAPVGGLAPTPAGAPGALTPPPVTSAPATATPSFAPPKPTVRLAPRTAAAPAPAVGSFLAPPKPVISTPAPAANATPAAPAPAAPQP